MSDYNDDRPGWTGKTVLLAGCGLLAVWAVLGYGTYLAVGFARQLGWL